MRVSLSPRIGVVDLFSGPGGLGEGFASFTDEAGTHPYHVDVSVERDASAHATLLLRAFLRQFPERMPGEYHDFLNRNGEEPDWSELYPEQWRAAQDETWNMELGTEEATLFLNARIERLRSSYGDATVLIGGPPCQAYSLVGRSRNAGLKDYRVEDDRRYFLYEEYVKVLRKLQPAAFVMENVKGLLSAKLNGKPIVHSILNSLRAAGYRLVPLVDGASLGAAMFNPDPVDFLVCAEEFGIPQERHRIIVVGLREDLLGSLDGADLPRLQRQREEFSIADVLGSLAPLRSGLSRGDGSEAWHEAITDAIGNVRAAIAGMFHRDAIVAELDRAERKLLSRTLSRDRARRPALPNRCPAELRDWLSDPALKRLPNDDTRSHRPDDLARYLFAACFAEGVGRSPNSSDFPDALAPDHKNWKSGKFADRFRVQLMDGASKTVTSHIAKDGHYYIHPDPSQCRSLTVREAARLQTFPDNYFFEGNRTSQYQQVGNAVPPLLGRQIAAALWPVLAQMVGLKHENSTDIAAAGS